MQTDTQKSKRLNKLRHRAERILSEGPEGIKDLPAADMQSLIHELGVYQIELEIQNEELRNARQELEISRDRYMELYDFAPVGYLTIDSKGLISEINLTGALLLGAERKDLIKKGISRFIAPESQDIFYLHRKQILETGEKASCELQMMKNGATEFYARLECMAVRDTEGNVSRIRASITDISMRKQAEKALEEERQRLFSLLDMIPAFTYLLGPDYTISFANKNFRKLFGDPGDRRCYEILMGRKEPCNACQMHRLIETKKPYSYEWTCNQRPGRRYLIYKDFFPGTNGDDLLVGLGFDITDIKKAEEDIRKSEEKYRNLFEQMPSGVAVFEGVDNGRDFIFRDFNRTGEKLDNVKREDFIGKSVKEAFPGIKDFGLFEVFQRVFRTGVHEYFPDARYSDDRISEAWRENWVYKLPAGEIVAIYNDVTERKKAQDFIRKLSHELIKHQEKERHMISLELHDTVAQDLLSLKIASDLFFQEFQDGPDKVKDRFSTFSKTLQKSIDKVRNISYDLRPPGLEDYGIVSILDEYLHDFSERTGLRVDFFYDSVKDQRFGYNIEINLYRLVQEGLNNIKKHANAAHATVRLLAGYPKLVLCIEDDGKGFDMEEYRNRPPREKRMGLRSMEERAHILNGRMTIESRPKSGTRVRIEIPIEEDR